MSTCIFILNGPNLNRLGSREPAIYGHHTLADIRAMCEQRAQAHGFAIDFRQTNHEGELIEHVHTAVDAAAATVINPAGYGHTSIALHDALKLLTTPLIEVHLSNTAARDDFRARSLVAPLAHGVISGLGAMSYGLGVDAACALASAHASKEE